MTNVTTIFGFCFLLFLVLVSGPVESSSRLEAELNPFRNVSSDLLIKTENDQNEHCH